MTEKLSRRRVKFYALNAERAWDDRGTGHVTSTFIDRVKGVSLVVRSESDGSLLLESKILPDTVYQKQQGTLIVWSEGESLDLALSFQERTGCDEIWEKICEVQGRDPSVQITQEVERGMERDMEREMESEEERYEDTSEAQMFVELPPCELGKLEDIRDMIGNCLTSAGCLDKLATYLESEGYIRKLVLLFRLCEDIDNIDGLHILYEIFKQIFHLNKHSLLDIMFSEEFIFDVVGALEYDPVCAPRKKHRQYLKSIARFKEVIPLDHTLLQNKIHQTYRVQYIQDVVLPTPQVFEENMLSTLSSFIYFNKVDIVNLIQEDKRILQTLFIQLASTEDDISLAKRRDLILFLKEFCTYSQTLQAAARDIFFKRLVSMDVLAAMEITLTIDDPTIKSASIDILSFIVEYSPSTVREYMLDQQRKVEEEQYLFNIMVEQTVLDVDPEMGGAVQLMGILKILIDPENMTTMAKYQQSEFFSFIYRYSMHAIIAPLLSNTANDEVGKEDYQTAQLLALILEFLSFCVENHTYHIKNYILQRDLLKRILVLMKSKHTFLVLCALRFMRKVVGLKEEFYIRHIVNSDLFGPIINALIKNNGRYNLLDSAILEMFEYIKREKIFLLCANIIEKYGPVLSKIDYVQTFRSLNLCYDEGLNGPQGIEKSPPNSSEDDTPPSLPLMVAVGRNMSPERYRRDMREMNVDEENWFNSDDEEMSSNVASSLLERTTMDKLRTTSKEPNNPHIPDNEANPTDSFNGETVHIGSDVDHQMSTNESIEDDKLVDDVTEEECLKRSRKAADLQETSSETKENNNFALSNDNAIPTSPPAKKVSLVDYEETSDDEETEDASVSEESSDLEPQSKRVKVASD